MISDASPKYLVDPETGQTHEITNPDTFQTLSDAGFTPETTEQFTDRNVKDVVRAHPIASGIASVAGQFTNQAFLGLPQLFREHTGTPEEQQKTQAIDRAITGEHPVLNIAGGALGTAATLLATPVGAGLDILGDAAAQGVTKAAALGGEKLAQSAATKLAGVAAKYGTENAAFNLPYHATESILGDPNIANEGILAHGAEDFALGAGLGLGTSLLGSVIKGAAQLAGGSEGTLKYYADKALVKQAGFLTSDFNKLADITGKENRYAAVQDMADFIRQNSSEWSQAMGANKILEAFQENIDGLENNMNTMRPMADKLGAKVPNSGINKLFNDVSEKYNKGNLDVAGAAVPDPTSSTNLYDNYFFNSATGKFDAKSSGGAGMDLTTPSSAPEIKALGNATKEYQGFMTEKLRGMGVPDPQIAEMLTSGAELPDLTTTEAHFLRRRLAAISWDASNNLKSDAIEDIRRGIGTMMDNAMKSVAGQSKDPELLNSFRETNQRYSKLTKTIDGVLERASSRESARNTFGLGSTIYTTAGALAGGGHGALLGLALGYAKQHLGNYLEYKTLGLAAKALEGIQGKIGTSIGEAISGQSAKSLALGSVGVLSRYTGDDKATPQQNLETIRNDLSLAQSSPEAMSQMMDSVTPGMSQFAPQNYALMGATAQRGIQYLQATAPQPPPPIFPGGPTPEWKASDNDMSKYARRLDAVFNPLSILNEIKTGTLSSEAVDAVKTVYPNLFGAIQTEVQKRLANAPANQVYKIRNKLGLILDGMQDPQVKAQTLQILQAGYAPNKSQVKPGTNKKIDAAGRMETPLNKALGQ